MHIQRAMPTTLNDAMRREHIVAKKIEDSSEFWTLIEQILDVECLFFEHRDTLLDAFVRGTLHTGIIRETEALFRDFELRQTLADHLGSHADWLQIPAFCVVENGACKLLWVREDLRCLGIGSAMIRGLGVHTASHQ